MLQSMGSQSIGHDLVIEKQQHTYKYICVFVCVCVCVYTYVYVCIYINFLFFGLMQDLLPNQGSNLCPLQWKHVFLTTGPPRKSLFFKVKC